LSGAVCFGFGRPQVYRTTDTRPALFPVSRLYRIGYSAHAVLVSLSPRLNSCLPPFICPESGKRSGFGCIQFLRCFFVFQLNHPTKELFEICDNLASMSSPPRGGGKGQIKRMPSSYRAGQGNEVKEWSAKSRPGRHIMVALVNLGRGVWKVVTTKEMTDSEKRLYTKVVGGR